MNWPRLRKWLRRTWITAGLASLAVLWWSRKAADLPPGTLASSDTVRFEDLPATLHFQPLRDPQPGALIFYPGSLVEPTAYAPLARAVAEAGFEAWIVRLPYGTAPLESHKQQVFAATRSIVDENSAGLRWVLAGHSLGARLAAEFVHQDQTRFAALVLLGTTHPRDFDLSHAPLDIVKIYGTEDGVAPYERSQANASLLPPSTRWVRIDGGNHAQFGFYHFQLGDGRATISRDRQQRIVLDTLLETLRH